MIILWVTSRPTRGTPAFTEHRHSKPFSILKEIPYGKE